MIVCWMALWQTYLKCASVSYLNQSQLIYKVKTKLFFYFDILWNEFIKIYPGEDVEHNHGLLCCWCSTYWAVEAAVWENHHIPHLTNIYIWFPDFLLLGSRSASCQTKKKNIWYHKCLGRNWTHWKEVKKQYTVEVSAFLLDLSYWEAQNHFWTLSYFISYKYLPNATFRIYSSASILTALTRMQRF